MVSNPALRVFVSLCDFQIPKDLKLGKIYISPGHKISLKTAVCFVKKFLKYSVPEPIRMAHIYANEMKNKKSVSEVKNTKI
ncbi:MAG: hypothetical protein CVT88_08215 [Candidatus Altiarchaeales archaeon HGW-Altiarchaeales-1]|nr:MAG: hypothetical protein CVT88_08215 [Candidatus Altiarchaeales archaeon HGW-Altiarchaeales-1]